MALINCSGIGWAYINQHNHTTIYQAERQIDSSSHLTTTTTTTAIVRVQTSRHSYRLSNFLQHFDDVSIYFPNDGKPFIFLTSVHLLYICGYSSNYHRCKWYLYVIRQTICLDLVISFTYLMVSYSFPCTTVCQSSQPILVADVCSGRFVLVNTHNAHMLFIEKPC